MLNEGTPPHLYFQTLRSTQGDFFNNFQYRYQFHCRSDSGRLFVASERSDS